MKRIIVPTDFSPFAEKAYRAAIQLSTQTAAEILLLHAVYTPLPWSSMTVREQEGYPETLGKTVEAEIKLDKLVSSALFSKVPVRYKVVHGAPYACVVDEATKQKADIVVMGSHGNDESGRYFLGSNVQKIIRQSPCPVLTLKNELKGKRWKRLLYASDFDEDVKKPFGVIEKLAKEMGSVIHLLFVNTPGNFKTTVDAEERMRNFAAQYPDLKFESGHYNHHELHEGILAYSKIVNADWIAMITHDRRKSPTHSFGITETVAFHADIPLLSVRK